MESDPLTRIDFATSNNKVKMKNCRPEERPIPLSGVCKFRFYAA